jgi:nucleotidyltransferase/DNA polymerase involved in DNA repair
VYYDVQFSNLLLELGNVSPVIEPGELGQLYVGVDGLQRLYGSPEDQIGMIQHTVTVWQRKLVAGSRESRANIARDGWKTRNRKWELRLSKGDKETEQAARFCVCTFARFGWGRGKFTAWVAATRANPGEAVIVSEKERVGFLASQPIAVLPLESDTHRRLWRLGIKTLSDLAQLPEAAVVSQFGRVGRRLWSLAAGAVVDPVVGRKTPEPIIAKVDFSHPVADRTMLSHSLDRLIEQALRHPQRAGWRILKAQVCARQENGTSWVSSATLNDPSADRRHIAAPLKIRLEHAQFVKAVETLAVEFTMFARGTDELQLFARDANSSARAGRQRALRTAVREIKARYRRSGLYQIVEVQPHSRLLERRYALIDYDP